MFRSSMLATLLAFLPSLAMAELLPLSETIEGSTGNPDIASYEFQTESPGVLTVIVRATSDVVINVVDEFGAQIVDIRPLENAPAFVDEAEENE